MFGGKYFPICFIIAQRIMRWVETLSESAFFCAKVTFNPQQRQTSWFILILTNTMIPVNIRKNIAFIISKYFFFFCCMQPDINFLKLRKLTKGENEVKAKMGQRNIFCILEDFETTCSIYILPCVFCFVFLHTKTIFLQPQLQLWQSWVGP